MRIECLEFGHSQALKLSARLRRLVLEKFQDGQKGWRVIELATSGVDNFVHASDSPEAAVREIALWFPEIEG